MDNFTSLHIGLDQVVPKMSLLSSMFQVPMLILTLSNSINSELSSLQVQECNLCGFFLVGIIEGLTLNTILTLSNSINNELEILCKCKNAIYVNFLFLVGIIKGLTLNALNFIICVEQELSKYSFCLTSN